MLTRRRSQLGSVASFFALSFAAGRLYAEEIKQFSIDEQPLSGALVAFYEQSGVTIAAPHKLVEGKRAQAVRGNMEPGEALAKLLASSGLQSTKLPDGAYTITLASSEGQSVRSFPPAADQQDDAAASSADSLAVTEIVVTASRIQRDGFNAPTPTTVISPEEMRMGGETDLGTALNEAPQFRATQSTTSAAGGLSPRPGAVTADLRGLGDIRTLVLIDGKRPVRTNGTSVNLSLLPFAIVERTEIVTGGASAAWGSDAVAGVVNVILDDDLEGLKASTQYGASSRGDGDKYEVSLAFGSPFADGRGHVEIAGEYMRDDGIAPANSRSWMKHGLISNPAYTPTNGEPQFLIAPDVGAITSRGGLITNVFAPAGPGFAPVPGHPLTNQYFLPDGSTAPFQFGSITSGTNTTGGDSITFGEYLPLTVPNSRDNAYAVATYELTPDIELRTDLLFGRTHSSSVSEPQQDGPPGTFNQPLTIRQDNAFLPASVRSQLAPSERIQMTRFDEDFGGLSERILDTDALQGSASLNGKFGDTWSWEVYYTYGRAESDTTVTRQRERSRFNEAVDSVIASGVPGVADGTPICRVRITDPSSQCVPLNVFGEGAPSADSVAYFQRDAQIDQTITLQAASASASGDAFSTWAGIASLASGVEWREETSEIMSDDLTANSLFVSPVLGGAPSQGRQSVLEGFGEIVVPVLHDLPMADLVELNGAVRVSDYSNSGSVTTWKAGGNWRVFNDLRFRATQSRDIRAPNISELVGASQRAISAGVNPFTGGNSANNVTITVNPDLEPEQADTYTAGVVYSPSFLRGFTLSVDYYNIDIDDYITQLTGQNILDRCYGGATELCSLITFGGIVPTPGGPAQSINIVSPLLNIANYKTSGVDFEASYMTASLLPGRLSSRLMVTYVDESVLDDGSSVPVNVVGDLSNDIRRGVPRFRASWANSYNFGGTTLNVRLRYIGSGLRDSTRSIDRNYLPAETYVDLGFEQALDFNGGDSKVVLFGGLRNLLDNAPPPNPNPAIYDVVGRYMTLGVRVDL